MAYVDDFQHDVFVSYARVDDQILPGGKDGWVTTLVDGLRIQLAQQLGRAELLVLWRDLSLPGHVPVTNEITSIVRQSATLLVVLSEGYLASDWCGRESEEFLSMAGESTHRLFIVEQTPVERPRKPKSFRERTGYPFWVRERADADARTLGVPAPDPSEPEYYRRLNRLAIELARELKRMRQARQPLPA
jgi:hypothetical protein